MKKITPEQLKEIIESHGKWITGRDDGKKADLAWANLAGANLCRADLTGADLAGANLAGAYLAGAYLRRADLPGAYLDGANLAGADLAGAKLAEANLTGADLAGADMTGADLTGADLAGANLAWADLARAISDKKYLQISCIGSRKGITTYCIDDNIVLCGCWNNFKGGTLAEFESRVEEVYGGNGKKPDKQYYTEYMAAIAFFKAAQGV